MNEQLRRFYDAFTTMHGQRALVLFRIVAGCTILSQLLAAMPERYFLFGPNGVYPAQRAADTSVFGLFSLVDSHLGFDILYASTIVVTLVWTLGLALPVTTLLVLVAWRSTFDRLPGLADGGDNLAQLILTYALICNLAGPAGERLVRRAPRWVRDLRAMVHNTGVFAIWIQVCVVYFVAGTSKLEGEAWQNGTALYYALSTDRYTIDGLVDPLLDAPLVLTMLAYTTIVFQVGFPFMVLLNRHSRRIALVVAMGFHVGIATVMGLTSFALFMIAADLTLLTDREVSGAADFLRRLWRWGGDRFGRQTTTQQSKKESKQ